MGPSQNLILRLQVMSVFVQMCAKRWDLPKFVDVPFVNFEFWRLFISVYVRCSL